ncbi:DUF624 domain-containing protein [Salibacterium salarium]|uniref:DUF624 domain-containing protein n=1 Tax=Salibacterium salarium TaxID=284579 RepID=A0A428NAC4_9BACI|nr:YesL family protein [Salibacterium salarium]RSL35336.1 DUF624 domain-containing protein [Salibacterium salarium]
MEINGFMGAFYNISVKVSKLAYVNILWITFTLAGLCVFGFMPATVAMFAVMRKWTNNITNVRVFQTFWDHYKSEFIKSNLLGGILLILGLMLYANFQLIQEPKLLESMLRVVLLFISVLFLIAVLFIFPVYVHFQLKAPLYLRTALILGMAYPHYTFMMAVCLYVLQEVFMFIPGLMPFFAASLISYLLMWFSNKVFKKVEDKQERYS